MVGLFVEHQLINERLAHNMLQWAHSGFSVGRCASPRAAPGPARLYPNNKLLVEDHAATVLYRTAYNPDFRTNLKAFRPADFIAELLQHLPYRRVRLIRRYGLYSSRSRGTWSRKPHLLRLAPEVWRRDHRAPAGAQDPASPDPSPSLPCLHAAPLGCTAFHLPVHPRRHGFARRSGWQVNFAPRTPRPSQTSRISSSIKRAISHAAGNGRLREYRYCIKFHSL